MFIHHGVIHYDWPTTDESGFADFVTRRAGADLCFTPSCKRGDRTNPY